MSFVGVHSIDDLIKYASIHSDIIDDILDHITILPDTLDPLYAHIAGPDYSVGIMGPYIDEVGASIQAIVKVLKENALSIGLEYGSFTKFIEQNLPMIVVEYASEYDTIKKLFMTSMWISSQCRNFGPFILNLFPTNA